MFILGHLAAGYLTAKAVVAVSAPALSGSEAGEIAFLGALVGAFPDLDFIPYFWRTRSIELRRHASHRDYISHAPVLWFCMGIAVSIYAASPFWRTAGTVLWLSSWSHFLLDTIGGRIMWLWPFTKKRFGIELAPDDRFVKGADEAAIAYYLRLFRTVYVPHPIFWMEVALIIATVIWFI